MVKPVILAGGPPKALSSLVPPQRSKHTLRILGKPVLYYPLNAVQSVLRSDTVIVYRYEDVEREALKYTLRPLQAVRQRGEGIEDAILTASEKLNDTDYILLAYGDIVIDKIAIHRLVETHLALEPAATLLVLPPDTRYLYTYGAVETDLDGRAKRVVEKPESMDILEQPFYMLGGFYILPTAIIDYIEKGNSLVDAINKLAETGRVATVHWNGLWIDIGYPADLLEAARQLLDRERGVVIEGKAEIEDTAVIKPPAVIGRHTYIDHHAVIKGPVYIGENAFIGSHSFVRHYSDIEDHVRVGAYTEIKNTVIQPHTLTDSHVYLGDSVIGENTVIGSHVVTLNVLPSQEKPPRLREHLVRPPSSKAKLKLGAIIGHSCRIGAGTILYPNTEIPAGVEIEPGSIISRGKKSGRRS